MTSEMNIGSIDTNSISYKRFVNDVAMCEAMKKSDVVTAYKHFHKIKNGDEDVVVHSLPDYCNKYTSHIETLMNKHNDYDNDYDFSDVKLCFDYAKYIDNIMKNYDFVIYMWDTTAETFIQIDDIDDIHYKTSIENNMYCSEYYVFVK